MDSRADMRHPSKGEVAGAVQIYLGPSGLPCFANAQPSPLGWAVGPRPVGPGDVRSLRRMNGGWRVNGGRRGTSPSHDSTMFLRCAIAKHCTWRGDAQRLQPPPYRSPGVPDEGTGGPFGALSTLRRRRHNLRAPPRPSPYSDQPGRYSRFRKRSASGALGIFMFFASHSIRFPARYATLPRWLASVSGPA